ncbi:MAG: IS4 family transposase [Lacipirellulaceae bacterium]
MSDWAFRELLGTELGDARRTDRLIAMVEAFSVDPEASPWQALGDAGQAKGAYRLWDNPECSVERLLSGHAQRTVERCSTRREVLVVQDSTEFNYTAHPATAGLGYTSCASKQGVKGHAALAVAPDGDVLGVLDFWFWTRDNAEVGKRKSRNHRPTQEKETARWWRGVRAAERALPPGGRAVVVGDAESDFFDLFAEPRAEGVELLVRVSHRRRVIDRPERYLIDAVLTRPVGTLTTEIPAADNRPARQATLQLYALGATVPLPANHPRQELRPVDLSWVLAREERPPAEATAVEWLLATTLPVTSREQAVACVERYRLRWRIERYFYALKQGCAVEKLELRSSERLMRALATYAIVAWRITHLLYHTRACPDEIALLLPLEDLVLRLGAPPAMRPPDGPLNNRDALRLIGKLGGHPSRTRDGPPGVKSLWRGLRRLHDQTQGYSLALLATNTVGCA